LNSTAMNCSDDHADPRTMESGEVVLPVRILSLSALELRQWEHRYSRVAHGYGNVVDTSCEAIAIEMRPKCRVTGCWGWSEYVADNVWHPLTLVIIVCIRVQCGGALQGPCKRCRPLLQIMGAYAKVFAFVWLRETNCAV
jgi:hypothetical protein